MPTTTDPGLEAFSKGLITGQVDNVMDPNYKSMKSGVDLHEKLGVASEVAGVALPFLKWVKGLFAAQTAFAPVEKFSAYIFKDGADHGKDAVFRGLGYDASHSAQLAKTWETQAAEKFARGEYTLKGAPNEFGQRINIGIELRGIGQSAGKTSNLNSGWMLRDNGTITLNTPFSGFTK